MDRIGRSLLVIVLLLFAGSQQGYAQPTAANGLTITSAIDGPLNVEPGSRPSLLVTVGHSRPGPYALDLDLPDGWRSFLFNGSFEATTEGETARVVSFLVPSATPAGDYSITAGVTHQEDSALRATVTIPVLIGMRHGLELTEGDLPPFMVAGDTGQSTFRLRNTGNVLSEVRLALHPRGGTAKTDSLLLRLSPDEVRELTVRFYPQADATRPRDFSLRLEATTADSIIASVQTRVKVYPRLEEGRLAYQRFPIEVMGGTAFLQDAGAGESLYRFQLTGHAPLDADGDVSLALDLRGPRYSNVSSSPFPMRDRYNARLSTERLLLDVGDGSRRLSPLLPSPRGFGAQVAQRFGGTEVGTFYYRDRRGFSPGSQMGAVIGTDDSKLASLEVSALQNNQRFASGRFVSVGANLQPSRRGHLRAAVVGSGSGAQRGLAFRADGAYRGERIGGTLRHVMYGTSYAGYQSDSRRTNADAFVVPVRWLRVQSRYNASHLRGQNQWRLDGRLTIARRVGASFEQSGHGYSTPSGYRSVREVKAGGFFNLQFGSALSFRGQAQIGQADRPFEGHAVRSERYQLSGTWRPSRMLNVAASTSFRQGGNLTSPLETRQLSTSLNVRAQFSSRLSLHLRGSTGRFSRASFTTRTTRSNLSLSYALPSGRRLQLIGVYNQASFLSSKGVGLSLTTPLALPLRKKRDSGLVSGTLLNGQHGGPISDVPILMGNAAVLTNTEGAFFLPEQAPGAYDLMVDMGSLPPGYIIAQGNPYPVEVHGGEETRVAFTTTPAAAIAAQVLLEPGDTIQRGSGPIREEGDEQLRPLNGALIELHGMDIHQRRLTGGQGEARFIGLKPGTYTLRLLQEHLADGQKADTSEFVVEVEGGEQGAVTFVVRPVKRKIRFLPVGDGSAPIKTTPQPASSEEAVEPAEEAEPAEPDEADPPAGRQTSAATGPPPAPASLEPEPAPSNTTPAPETPAYTIVLATLTTAAQAERAAERLRTRVPDVSLVVELDESTSRYRVVTGGWPTWGAAAEALAPLRRTAVPDAWIWKRP